MKNLTNIDILAIFVFGIFFAAFINLDETLGLICIGIFTFMFVYSKDFRKKFDVGGRK